MILKERIERFSGFLKNSRRGLHSSQGLVSPMSVTVKKRMQSELSRLYGDNLKPLTRERKSGTKFKAL